MKISDVIGHFSANHPDQIAIIIGDQSWTYERLWSAVESRSTWLLENGIRPGVGVGVRGQNSAEFIIHALAVMHAGAVVFPISHNLKRAELTELIEKTRIHVLWDDEAGESVALDSIGVFDWRWMVISDAVDDQPIINHVADPALVRFTSGTTGKAKGVILSHKSILERTAAANQVLSLGRKDVVIWVLSMAYHFVVSILLYLRYGCTICICENFMGDYIIERTRAVGGTFLYASPMHIRMLSRDQTDVTMPSLKRVISTSMAIDARLCQAFQQRFDLPITQAFGIIEIGLPIINTELAEDFPGSIGHALPAYKVAIIDSSGVPCPDDTVGQLGIAGPGMFDAYLNPPIPREEALQFGYFMTGDLARRDATGRLVVVGREKNVINVSGNKAFPEEIEHVINQFGGVLKSRVKGFAHPLLNECVMAEVILMPGAAIDIEELISFCRKRLSTYKVPQKIDLVDDLPMTDSGKIKRT